VVRFRLDEADIVQIDIVVRIWGRSFSTRSGALMRCFQCLTLVQQVGSLRRVEWNGIFDQFGEIGVGTDKVTCLTVADTVKKPYQSTGVSDSLLIPNDFFARSRSLILWLVAVFLYTKLLISLAYGKDQ